MQRSLIAIAGLAVSGVLVVACTMKAPQDVSQASAKAAAFAPSVNLAAAVPAPKPALAEQAASPAVGTTARVEISPKPAAKPIVTSTANVVKDVVVVADNRENTVENKPSRLATLASAAKSLPLLSMMRGEDGRISPINMMMKIRSMMPMCAGGNCVTTSSGFQRVNAKEPIKPLTIATAG